VAAAHPAGSDGVVAALRAHDNVPVVSHLPTRLASASTSAVLTPREVEVLTLIAAGHTAAEVARELGISPKTVENRKQSIFAKLDVQNQAHAVAVALRSGILPPRLSASGG
jgi:DNA-binding CsgD family transcriptional regulator